MKRRMLNAIAFICATLFAGLVAGQTYPNRSIRLVVPFAPGGTSDLTARVVAQRVSQTIGQPMVVENRSGAVGTIGINYVAKSAPDGYTLLLTDTTFAILPGVAAKLPYNPIKDFAPIILGITVPSVVVVNPLLPVKTLKELIEFARKNPGKIAYGSGGVGSAVHLAGAFLADVAKIDLIHVPYRGAGPAITDVVSGQIQMVIPSMPTVVPFIKGGQLRALAITSSKRSNQLPDVPTVAETGLPDYEAISWFGFSAPAGTPKAIIEQLNTQMAKALADKDVQDTLVKQGADIAGGTSEQFSRFIVSEMKKWAEIAKASNVTADLN